MAVSPRHLTSRTLHFFTPPRPFPHPLHFANQNPLWVRSIFHLKVKLI